MTRPTDTDVADGTSVDRRARASATPRRIFSASTQPPVGSVSGSSTTNSSPPNRAPVSMLPDARPDHVADEAQRPVADEVADAGR